MSANREASLSKAKRRFLLNLAVCVSLALIVALALADSDEEKATAPVEAIRNHTERPFSNLSRGELAYLNGQILGLGEHPDTMPEYEAEWVMKVSRAEVGRHPVLRNAKEAELELLAEEFFKGYTERFHDYYDDGRARELGYRFGVRHNPSLRGHTVPPSVYRHLAANEQKLKTLYPIPDEATWRLFCSAFQKGFDQGYYIVEEGATVESVREEIELLEE